VAAGVLAAAWLTARGQDRWYLIYRRLVGEKAAIEPTGESSLV